MKAYAGIGSRETPRDIIALMEKVAAHLASQGYVLHSGGADGADTAFETGCKNANGDMKIFLPSQGWNRRPRNQHYIVPEWPPSMAIASKIHPGWMYLGEFVQKLHSRNVNQILGEDLQTHVKFVVCWTPDGAITKGETSKKTGGTGQAIRVASEYNIPVYNLQRPEHRQIVEGWLNETNKMRIFKLSPSDFAFLWKECKRCYWLKYAQSIPRPFTPMAKIFNTIDGGMQSFFHGKVLSEIDPSLPKIKVIGKNMSCTSEAMQFEDLGAQVYVHGKTDGLAEDLENEGYVIIDYKTSMPKPEHLLIYAAQLHSYAFAFSKASGGALAFSPVTRLGLLVYEPKIFDVNGVNANLSGQITWTELDMDKKWFKQMLHDVAKLLMQETPPESNPDCPFCKYSNAINDWQHPAEVQ